MATLNQQQLNRFFEILNSSKLFSELTELFQITDALTYASVNLGLDDAQKIKIPALRGYLGDYDADTNTPNLVDGVGVHLDTYNISEAGTRDFGSGSITFKQDDLVRYLNGKWQKYTLVNKTSDVVNDSEDGTGFFAPFVLIGTRHFILFKGTANTDPTKRTTLEINDTIVGHDPSGGFLMATYRGGTVTDYTNDAVYEKFGGYQI
jgi:hypothetical protein